MRRKGKGQGEGERDMRRRRRKKGKEINSYFREGNTKMIGINGNNEVE